VVLDYCERRRAMFIVDPPQKWNDKSVPLKKDPGSGGIDDPFFKPDRNANAAIYFPRILALDPLENGRIREFVPCGAVCGVIARMDRERGIWKAPAGLDAKVMGAANLSIVLTDNEQNQLNKAGINCLRILPPTGIVVWGSRTLQGSDEFIGEWKYIPVRRTALFIEESLYRGTKWVLFEPNDESLWSEMRINVGAFLNDLFRKGAFQGRTANEAYFVKCDSETTTQVDVDGGVVNIIVGFAPLKPAEFIIIKIQQMARRKNK
jgi:phage tail sheath protein FI